MTCFKQLGLSAPRLKAIEAKGFSTPTPIQCLTIPHLLHKDSDLIAQANTGSGKTAAFALPLLEKLDPSSAAIQALVLAPTRELALQIAQEIDSLKGDSGIRVLPIYGGQAIQTQITGLRKGVNIVVGTPGRMLDHIRQGNINLKKVDFMVLDEADEMLQMGFIEDIESILEVTPKEKRVLLFSATMPSAIKRLAERYMGAYEHLAVEQARAMGQIGQSYIDVRGYNKVEVLHRVLMGEKNFYGIVFCRTRKDVDEVSAALLHKGHQVDRLHGDVSQAQRESILRKMKAKKLHVLVATDVAARGIDVKNLTHVINFSLPEAVETYVHRVGRTGRAGQTGKAISFLGGRDQGLLQRIEQHTGAPFSQQAIPETGAVIDAQKHQAINHLNSLIHQADLTHYQAWAHQLAESHNLETVAAALLKGLFGDKVDAASYPPLKRLNRSQQSKPPKSSSFRKRSGGFPKGKKRSFRNR